MCMYNFLQAIKMEREVLNISFFFWLSEGFWKLANLFREQPAQMIWFLSAI